MSIFLGSKNALNLVYFWVFQKKYTVPDHPSHTNRKPPPGPFVTALAKRTGPPPFVTGTKVTKYVAILRAQTRSQKQTLLCDDDHETD